MLKWKIVSSKKGKIVSGCKVYKSILYQNGKKYTGSYKNYRYKSGQKLTGTKDGITYQDGKVVSAQNVEKVSNTAIVDVQDTHLLNRLNIDDRS